MSKLTILLVPFVLAVSVAADTSFPAGVLATGTMGVTNPPKPTTGTSINQTSYSRLLSVNSIDVHKKTPLSDHKNHSLLLIGLLCLRSPHAE